MIFVFCQKGVSMKNLLITVLTIALAGVVGLQVFSSGAQRPDSSNVLTTEDIVFDELQAVASKMEDFCWYFFTQFRERKPKDFTEKFFSEKIKMVSKEIEHATSNILKLRNETISVKIQEKIENLMSSVSGKVLRLRRMFSLLFDTANFTPAQRKSSEDHLHKLEEKLNLAITKIK